MNNKAGNLSHHLSQKIMVNKYVTWYTFVVVSRTKVVTLLKYLQYVGC